MWKRIRLDLAEWGYEGYWVEFLPDISMGAYERIMAEGLPTGEGAADVRLTIPFSRRVLAAICVAWNLVDMYGNVLPPPIEDEASLSALPLRLSIRLSEHALELIAREQAPLGASSADGSGMGSADSSAGDRSASILLTN